MISEKNVLKSDFEHKKVLQGNTCHTIALYVREKRSITRGFGGKKILIQIHEITHTLGDEVVLPSDIALATPIFDSALLSV